MADKKRQSCDWKSKLTRKEARFVERLEAAQAAGRQASVALAPIRNRAIQRYRYEEAKASPPAQSAHTQKEV